MQGFFCSAGIELSNCCSCVHRLFPFNFFLLPRSGRLIGSVWYGIKHAFLQLPFVQTPDHFLYESIRYCEKKNNLSQDISYNRMYRSDWLAA
jgi:hypothetical protein